MALTFVFLLGYYPLVKPRFERIRLPLVRVLCKLLLCNGGILAMYGLVLLLVPAGSISEELKTTALVVSLVTLAMGNAAFLLYDRALHNLLQVYQLVWRPKLHKMLGGSRRRIIVGPLAFRKVSLYTPVLLCQGRP